MKRIVLGLLMCTATVGFAIHPQKSANNSKGGKGKHRIEIKINGLKDTTLILGYYFGNNKYVQDTFPVNSHGVATISGDSLLKQGIYIAILPDKSNFDFLVDQGQEFAIETSKEDLWGNLRFKNSPINSDFIRYQRYMKEKQEELAAINKAAKADSSNATLQKASQEKVKNLDKEVRAFWKETRLAQGNNLLANIIAMVETPVIPEITIPQGTHNPDSLRWMKSYRYQKEHYWDNINLSNPAILRTPVFENRLKGYFSNILVQIPDSLYKEIDDIIARSAANSETYQYTVSFLLNHFNQSQIMSHDAVLVYIADKYYLNKKAPWATDDLITKLTTRVNRIRPNLIGKSAPTLVMESDNGEYMALQQVKADYTVVYFWEPDCSHCQKETPVLHDLFNKYRDKGLQVYAVYTQYKKDEWKKYIDEKGYDWINVWDSNYNSNFRALYDVTSTPTVFLLDKDKKIIAKKISVETLGDILKSQIKQ